MWDCILSILVIFHLATEYVHYVFEYICGRREGGILTDILKHRKSSRKTELLTQIQRDIDSIKKEIGNLTRRKMMFDNVVRETLNRLCQDDLINDSEFLDYITDLRLEMDSTQDYDRNIVQLAVISYVHFNRKIKSIQERCAEHEMKMMGFTKQVPTCKGCGERHEEGSFHCLPGNQGG